MTQFNEGDYSLKKGADDRIENRDLTNKIFPNRDYPPIPLNPALENAPIQITDDTSTPVETGLVKNGKIVIGDVYKKDPESQGGDNPYRELGLYFYRDVQIPGIVSDVDAKLEIVSSITGLTKEQLVGEIVRALQKKYSLAGIFVLNQVPVKPIVK